MSTKKAVAAATTVKEATTTKVAKGSKTATIKAKLKENKKDLDTKNIKDTVKQIVQSERDIRYKYPEDIDNQLDRKAWRQKIRNKMRAYERALTKLEAGTKEYIKLEREHKAYRKEVLMVP